MSPTDPLSQTPDRPTVNAADPIPEAHPEVDLCRPSSRIIQKSPTVLRPCPSRPFPTPPSAGCVKYLGRVRPTSAGTLPGACLPSSAPRPAPRLPAASRAIASTVTSTGVPPTSGDIPGSGLFLTRAARTRGTHQGAEGTPGRRPGPRALGRPPKGRRPGPPRIPNGRGGPAPTRGHPPLHPLSAPHSPTCAWPSTPASGRRDAQVTRSHPRGGAAYWSRDASVSPLANGAGRPRGVGRGRWRHCWAPGAAGCPATLRVPVSRVAPAGSPAQSG